MAAAGNRTCAGNQLNAQPATFAPACEALAALEAKGVVAKSRGALNIVSREGLKASACECFKLIEERFSWQRAMKHYEHRLDPYA